MLLLGMAHEHVCGVADFHAVAAAVAGVAEAGYDLGVLMRVMVLGGYDGPRTA